MRVKVQFAGSGDEVTIYNSPVVPRIGEYVALIEGDNKLGYHVTSIWHVPSNDAVIVVVTPPVVLS